MTHFTSTATAQALPRRKRFWHWVKDIVIGGLILSVALVLIGMSYQDIATARDNRAYPPVGQLVDVGGYKMHLYCLGEGSPTVILEGGQAANVATWAWIQPEVAKQTRVCAYDRAGVGWSEASPNPRDARHLAEELHALLDKAEILPPYLLVGHSFGGLVTRLYAAQYPNEVAGMVWLDVQHPEQWTRQPENRAQFEQILTLTRVGPRLARLGLVRISNYFPLVQELPACAAAQYKAWVDTTRFMQVNGAEFQAQPESMQQFQATGSLGDLPLIVLTATDHGFSPEQSAKLEAQWLEMQDELAILSTNSTHQMVAGATHGSLQVDEQDARVSSAAIVKLVEMVRIGASLFNRFAKHHVMQY